MNSWVDLLDLIGPLLPALVVILFAIDVFSNPNAKEMQWTRTKFWTMRKRH